MKEFMFFVEWGLMVAVIVPVAAFTFSATFRNRIIRLFDKEKKNEIEMEVSADQMAESAAQRAADAQRNKEIQVGALTTARDLRHEIVRKLRESVATSQQRTADKERRATAAQTRIQKAAAEDRAGERQPEFEAAQSDYQRLHQGALHEASELLRLEEELQKAEEEHRAVERQLQVALLELEEKRADNARLQEELDRLKLRRQAATTIEKALVASDSIEALSTTPPSLDVEAARTAANLAESRLNALRDTAEAINANRELQDPAATRAAEKRLANLMKNRS